MEKERCDERQCEQRAHAEGGGLVGEDQRQKTSVKGGQYLTGRLGGVKVLVMENRDRKGDDDPSHILYFAEAAPRQERGDGQRGASMPPDRQKPSTPQRSGFQRHAGGGADWQAPLRQDGAVRQPAGGGEDDGPPWER
jgi:hypothetical protein